MKLRHALSMISLCALPLVSRPAFADSVSDGTCRAMAEAGAAAALGTALAAIDSTPAVVAAKFYDAFVRQDANGMESLYAPNVKFHDTAFDYSDRAGTMKMWRFNFSQKGKKVFSYRILGVNGNVVTAHWAADYQLNGRPVHNEVDTQLTIVDGKIVKHQDLWDWNAWSRQALPLGRLSELPALKFVIIGAMRTIVYVSPDN